MRLVILLWIWFLILGKLPLFVSFEIDNLLCMIDLLILTLKRKSIYWLAGL